MAWNRAADSASWYLGMLQVPAGLMDPCLFQHTPRPAARPSPAADALCLLFMSKAVIPPTILFFLCLARPAKQPIILAWRQVAVGAEGPQGEAKEEQAGAEEEQAEGDEELAVYADEQSAPAPAPLEDAAEKDEL